MNNKLPLISVAVILIITATAGVILLKPNNKSNNSENLNKSTASTVESTISPTSQSTDNSTNTNPTGTATDTEQSFSIEGGSYYFKPNEIRVNKGNKVKVTLTAKGGMPHNFSIDEFNIESDTVSNGQTTTVEFTADKSGTFVFYCGVSNHRQMGQMGKLIVE